MGYPVGPLLQALAERILANLVFIEAHAPKPEDPDQNRAPFSDTQLLISLLGVLVFPHERAPDALGDLLKGYKPLADAITIHFPPAAMRADGVEIAGPKGDVERVDPASMKSLPRLLRNSIAHFNVRPLDRNGRFGGIRVWNEDDRGKVTLVADLEFDQLRAFARHVLRSLARPRRDLALDDPEDPLPGLLNGNRARSKPKDKKPPRVTDTIWAKLLAACDGDAGRAKAVMDQALKPKTAEIKAATA